MTESPPEETGNGEESLADTDAEIAEISKGEGEGEEEPLSDTEPEEGQLQEGSDGD